MFFICFSSVYIYAEEEYPFLEQLRLKLQEQKWERAEIQNIIQECRKLEWSGADPEHAEIAALALKYGKKESDPLKVQEQARLINQISSQSMEMKKIGLERKEIAGVVMKSTREIYRNINMNRNMYENDATGEKNT